MGGGDQKVRGNEKGHLSWGKNNRPGDKAFGRAIDYEEVKKNVETKNEVPVS